MSYLGTNTAGRTRHVADAPGTATRSDSRRRGTLDAALTGGDLMCEAILAAGVPESSGASTPMITTRQQSETCHQGFAASALSQQGWNSPLSTREVPIHRAP